MHVFANLTMGYYDDKNSVKIYDTFNYNFNALLNYHVRRTSARSEIEYYPAKWLMLKTGVQFSFNKTDLLWSLDWRNYVNLPDYINFNEKYFSNGVYWISPGIFTHFDRSMLFTLWAAWPGKLPIVLKQNLNCTIKNYKTYLSEKRRIFLFRKISGRVLPKEWNCPSSEFAWKTKNSVSGSITAILRPGTADPEI